MKLIAMGLLLLGGAVVALAGGPTAAPEIDPAMGAGALALLAGGLLIVRSRKKS